MANKIYLVNYLNELVEVEVDSKDIAICSSSSNPKDIDCRIIYFKEDIEGRLDLNNNLLQVVDELLMLIENDRYIVEVKDGHFVLNNYLAIIADILDVKLSYRDVDFPSFCISFDKEELNMVDDLIDKEITEQQYNTLPAQWKSLYYVKQERIYLSKLGRTLIAEHK